MKTIILYATKYGAAQEIAGRIADGIKNGAADETCVIQKLEKTFPSLEDFDRVILGSSVYAGSIRKEAKKFLAKNEGILQDKILGLFLSGIGTDEKDTYFKSNFSENLLRKAKAKSFLGGVFDPKKANFIERCIIKAVAKQSARIDTINDKKIGKFAEAMKA